MYMVRGSANNRLDILLLHHLTEIVVSLHRSQILGRASQVVVVHVAKRNNIFTGNVPKIVSSLPGHTDAANIQLLIRTITPSKRTLLAQREAGNCTSGRHEEMTAGDRIGHVEFSF